MDSPGKDNTGSEEGLIVPRDLEEALAIKAARGAGIGILAGGTDLMVKRRQGHVSPPLLYLGRIEQLGRLDVEGGRLVIGAMVTYQELLEHADAAALFPSLAEACRQIGSVQIRNLATMAGNLMNASPSGDAICPLITLDSEVVLESSLAKRRLPVQELFTGPGATVIGEDEILTSIELPLPPDGHRAVFFKVGARKAMAITKVSLAAAWLPVGGRLGRVRLCFGAVGPTVIRAEKLERLLEGRSPDEPGLVDRAMELAGRLVRPIGDIRSTADYRRQVSRNLVRRLFRHFREAS